MGGCLSSPSKPTTQPQKPSALGGGGHAQKFETIRDRFETIEEVQDGLRGAGLESSDLIVAIDLTKSNEWSGKHSFQGKCLHSTAQGTNPYKSVIQIVAKTLSKFDDDQLIPTFGFGDLTSKEHSLISFSPNGKPLHTLDAVIAAYDSYIDHVSLSGPTSFAPAIYKAIEIVRGSRGQYHILVIVADGQVSPGACMGATAEAIVEASNYPLSIVMVGVGDGPFDNMENFDDELPQRVFDNFQFVNFTKLGARATQLNYSASKWEADFALSALQEIPDQFAIIQKLGLLGKTEFARPVRPVQVYSIQGAPAQGAAAQQTGQKYPRV